MSDLKPGLIYTSLESSGIDVMGGEQKTLDTIADDFHHIYMQVTGKSVYNNHLDAFKELPDAKIIRITVEFVDRNEEAASENYLAWQDRLNSYIAEQEAADVGSTN